MPIINRIADYFDEMQEWRHHMHTHPELGFNCFETAKFVKSKLEEFGVDEIYTEIAKTGIVAIIRGKSTGKTIGLRADMDALPLEEATGKEYKSKKTGVMHACGHDGHTTMLLGAAKYLCETRNFSGNVALIFQPAEEGGGGADVMCKEGIMDRFRIDEVYGIHNDPGAPLGFFQTCSGPNMAAADDFTIKILGQGGHAAEPEETIDPLVTGVQLVQAIQTISSRNLAALEKVVISITQFHAGTTHNIIPNEAYINGTVRTLSKEAQSLVVKRLQELCKGHSLGFGGKIKLDYNYGYPPTVNHQKETQFAGEVAKEIVGEQNVDINAKPIMASEDFSYMIEERPGCYFHVGQGTGVPVHNPEYDFNDDLSPVGASFFARLVEKSNPIK
ncbi:M20 family metallopeptidase [Paracoccaceae bacterium]|nr:M20 family metallopeptidase [Paracoccaceae bacterium]|tara:strand:- start:14 stop:1177 length:1164 start_codon:yes stop_codon:yes gene_type:complete